MVQELMRRLEEASIDAFSATERTIAEVYVGGAPSVSVWIRDAKCLERASELLREVRAQSTIVQCPSCGYDLQGHSGETSCPECGRDLRAACPDVECPQCHEPVPADFDICWNCGADVPARDQGNV